MEHEPFLPASHGNAGVEGFADVRLGAWFLLRRDDKGESECHEHESERGENATFEAPASAQFALGPIFGVVIVFHESSPLRYLFFSCCPCLHDFGGAAVGLGMSNVQAAPKQKVFPIV